MPRPVLQAMVIADNVYEDRVTGKHVIAGTFTGIAIKPALQKTPEQEHHDQPSGQTLRRIQDPRVMGVPWLYLALTEVYGEVQIELRYVDLSDSTLHFSVKLTLSSKDPVAVSEYTIPLPMFPATKVGEFSLDALYENEILGSWRISVRNLENPSSESEKT